MPRYKLSYFDFPGGRGEDARIALHLAGADWEDDRVKGPSWPERKPGTPWGNMPVLEVEGKGTLGQSNAVLAYLGREFGLHPEDAFEAARHEAIMNAVEDLRCALGPSLSTKDPEEKKRLREGLAAGYIPAWGANVEAQIGDGPFLAGDRLCVADLKLFVVGKWFTSGALDHIPTDVLAGFPKLSRLMSAVREHPGVQGWYARG